MTGYILFVFYTFLILYLFYKSGFFKNIPGLGLKWIVGFFLIKVCVGFFLSYIYKHYYDPETADIYKYFNDGMYLYSILFENPFDYARILTGLGIQHEHVENYLNNMQYWFRPWESPLYNDNRVVIRFNALVGIFSFGNIHIHTLFANLLSFTGLVALYKFFTKYISKEKIALLKWGVFLFPSLLFWGSGVLKEAILIGCFGLLIYNLDTLMNNKNIKITKVLILIVCFWILTLLKPYIIILFIPCLAGFYISKNKGFYKKQLSYISGYIFLFIIAILFHLFLPAYDPVWLIARKHNDLINLSLSVEAGSLLYKEYLKPEFFEIVKNMPKAFITTIVRPHIFEANNVFMIFAAIENMLGIIAISISLTFTRNIKYQHSITWLSLWFCLAGFTFIGLTTPVAGAIVRYKIIMLPFLWLIIINLLDVERIKKFINLRSKDSL